MNGAFWYCEGPFRDTFSMMILLIAFLKRTSSEGAAASQPTCLFFRRPPVWWSYSLPPQLQDRERGRYQAASQPSFLSFSRSRVWWNSSLSLPALPVDMPCCDEALLFLLNPRTGNGGGVVWQVPPASPRSRRWCVCRPASEEHSHAETSSWWDSKKSCFSIW